MQLFSASLNKMILDLSSWDFFLSSLYNASSQFPFTHLSIGASSDKSPRKFNLHLDHTWVAVERQKVDTRCRNTAIVHAPSFFNSIFFSFSFLSSFPLPLPKTKYKSTSKCSFHFKRFWTISQVTSNLSEDFLFWSFKKRRFFFLLLMKSWQRDFRRKLFSLPLRAF